MLSILAPRSSHFIPLKFMPKVKFQGNAIECSSGANLRKIMLDAGWDGLYNGNSRYINCRGIGSCGTCAVRIEGEVSPANWKDKGRRSLPPHDKTKDLRLACQTKVLGDIEVFKYDGFWGQGDKEKGEERNKEESKR